MGIDPLKHIPTFEHIPSCSFWEQTGKSPDGKRTCRCLIYNTPGDDDELVILLEDITDATRSREQLDDFEHLFNLVSDFAHVGCVSYNPLTGEGYTKGPWAKNYGEAENTPASQATGGRSIPTTGNTLRRSSNASKPEKSGLSSTKCAS